MENKTNVVPSMEDRVTKSLELRRPSIERIVTLGKECLEHDSSWYEFYERCRELLAQENKIIRTLSK